MVLMRSGRSSSFCAWYSVISTSSLPGSALAGSSPTIRKATLPSAVGRFSSSPSFQAQALRQAGGDHRRVVIIGVQEAPFFDRIRAQRLRIFRVDAGQGQGGYIRPAVKIRRDVDRAAQRSGNRPDAFHRSHPVEQLARESLAGLERDGHIHLPGGRQHVRLEGLHHGGQEDVHAEDHQRAEYDRQRGQEGPQLAPPQIAPRQFDLKPEHDIPAL